VIATELLVARAAIVIAAVWIVYLQRKLSGQDEVLKSAEAALEAADEAIESSEAARKAAEAAINIYQHVLRDVAIGHTTLEMTDDGRIVATHGSFGKVSLH
jgi:ATP/maltotriose-dependent transcriptional regulator MalT